MYPLGKYKNRAHRTLIVKTMLQSKMESEISLPEEHFPEKLLLKSKTVDITLKLTQRDWVKE